MFVARNSLLFVDGVNLVVVSLLISTLASRYIIALTVRYNVTTSTIMPGRQENVFNLRDKSGNFFILLHVSKLFTASRHARDIWSSDKSEDDQLLKF